MSKILAVTGAAGKKSGGDFVKILSENIDDVRQMFPDGIRLMVRSGSDKDFPAPIAQYADVLEGELKDAEYLDRAFAGVDTLVHIAGISCSPYIADAAARCGVRRLILVHTTGVFSKYKAAGEGYRRIDEYVRGVCEENNITLTICRPTMIYGNVHDRNVVEFIKMVDRFPIMPVVAGARYRLQPVHFTDLAKAYYLVLTNEQATAGREFNLSGKEPIYLRDMLTIIGRELGKKTRFISCPYFVAYAGAWVLYLLTLTKKDYREKVQRLCEERVFDHSAAAEAFGYDPIGFEQGIVGEAAEYLAAKKPAE